MQTTVIDARRVTPAQVERMFELMGEYYQGTTYDAFRRDLAEKQKVILLLGEDGVIEGFSTIAQQKMVAGGRPFIALFSGDTVLSRRYWGNGALAMAFGRYLLRTKLRHPFTDVDWFLISKGYRTYLLMTNNFPDHHPRYEAPIPASVREKMDVFYGGRFPSAYRPAEGLVEFGAAKTYHLKPLVAEITDELRAHPRIAFFEARNPRWTEGMELACIAKVSIWIPVRYVLKRTMKTLRAVMKSTEPRPARTPERYALARVPVETAPTANEKLFSKPPYESEENA